MLIALIEASGVTAITTGNYQPVNGPLQIDRSHLDHYAMPAPIGIADGYEINGRFFLLGVAFGRADPTDGQMAEANSILATLTVEPAR